MDWLLCHIPFLSIDDREANPQDALASPTHVMIDLLMIDRPIASTTLTDEDM